MEGVEFMQSKKYLIWGKTYPELSHKYVETVCSGVADMETGELFRIYPLSERYLPSGRIPKWSVLELQLTRSRSDRRPESFKVNPSTIRHCGVIPTDNGWSQRKKILLAEGNLVQNHTLLLNQSKERRRSLGIVKPIEIVDVSLSRVPERELEEAKAKYREIEAQRDLWEPGEKMVTPLRWKPRIKFMCEGESEPLDRVMLDWEVCEVAKRHEGDEDGFRKEFMASGVHGKDTHLILGNMSQHPQTFVVVSVFYPPKQSTQLGLF
jgi:hypothetical protein